MILGYLQPNLFSKVFAGIFWMLLCFWFVFRESAPQSVNISALTNSCCAGPFISMFKCYLVLHWRVQCSGSKGALCPGVYRSALDRGQRPPFSCLITSRFVCAEHIPGPKMCSLRRMDGWYGTPGGGRSIHSWLLLLLIVWHTYLNRGGDYHQNSNKWTFLLLGQ